MTTGRWSFGLWASSLLLSSLSRIVLKNSASGCRINPAAGPLSTDGRIKYKATVMKTQCLLVDWRRARERPIPLTSVVGMYNVAEYMNNECV